MLEENQIKNNWIETSREQYRKEGNGKEIQLLATCVQYKEKSWSKSTVQSD